MSRISSRAGVAGAIALLLSAGLIAGCAPTAPVQESMPASSHVSTEQADAQGVDEATAAALSFDYSAPLEENGRWKGVRALDYVTLPEGYMGIAVPAEAVDVEARVQSTVDSIASSFSTTEQVTDRAVADGDTVNIDYVGSIDGVEFEGGSTHGAGTTVTIGVTSYIDDFLEQVVGHKPGETFDVEVTFPEDYGKEELNGKDAVFSVTVNYIERTVVPEVTDLWVSANLLDMYGWSTVDQMRTEIAEEYAGQAKMAYVRQYLLDNSQVSEVPGEMVEYCKGDMMFQYASYAQTYGFDLNGFVSMMTNGGDVDALVEANQDAIAEQARTMLVCQALVEQENIEVSDDFVAEYFSSLVGVSDISGYIQGYGMPYLRMQTANEVAVSKVADYAVVEGAAQPRTADEPEAAEDEKAEGAEKTDKADEPEAETDKADEPVADKADETEAAETEKADGAKADDVESSKK